MMIDNLLWLLIGAFIGVVTTGLCAAKGIYESNLSAYRKGMRKGYAKAQELEMEHQQSFESLDQEFKEVQEDVESWRH